MHYLTYFLQRQHPSRGPPGLSLLLFELAGVACLPRCPSTPSSFMRRGQGEAAFSVESLRRLDGTKPVRAPCIMQHLQRQLTIVAGPGVGVGPLLGDIAGSRESSEDLTSDCPGGKDLRVTRPGSTRVEREVSHEFHS